MSECWTCMGPCDPTYHASSKRIRAWMIRKISDAQAAPPVIVPRTKYPRGFGNVHELRSPAARKAARK
jgi:hypothetical protein